jgi:hypothetical protein
MHVFCGLGKVRLDADELADHRFLEALSEKTQARWLAALLNSDDLHARSAGLYLDGAFADMRSKSVAAQEARDELVQLAVGSSDPSVYALAVYMCRRHTDESAGGACQQISWQGWARVDPDNAVPWIAVAGLARTNNDQAAETEAFNRAAQARRYDSYTDSPLSFADRALPDGVSALERSYMATQVIGIEATTAIAPYSPLSRHCSPKAVQDAGVKQQCNDLAENLTAHGNTLVDFAIGVLIGKQAGWPAARIEAMQQERDAMIESTMQVVPRDDPDPWSCAGVARLNDYVSLRNQLGEIGAAKALRERSGESIPALARKYADDMEEILREVQRRSAQDHPQDSQP